MTQSKIIARVEVWIWVLIYLGLVLLALGLSVRGDDASMGWGIVAFGVALDVVGMVLIWVRSRMSDKAGGKVP
jgi:hypothetical protein